jgi:hypothetical protein
VRQPHAAGENIERFPRLAANELASLWTWISIWHKQASWVAWSLAAAPVEKDPSSSSLNEFSDEFPNAHVPKLGLER